MAYWRDALPVREKATQVQIGCSSSTTLDINPEVRSPPLFANLVVDLDKDSMQIGCPNPMPMLEPTPTVRKSDEGILRYAEASTYLYPEDGIADDTSTEDSESDKSNADDESDDCGASTCNALLHKAVANGSRPSQSVIDVKWWMRCIQTNRQGVGWKTLFWKFRRPKGMDDACGAC